MIVINIIMSNGLVVKNNGRIVSMPIKELKKYKLNYELLEKYYIEDDIILYLYGETEGNIPFNKYEFNYVNPKGEVFIFLTNIKNQYINLTIEFFKTFYEYSEDLDDDLISDELYNLDNDEYDYTDGFIVDDR